MGSNDRQGFALLVAVVAVVILAILAAVVVPSTMHMLNDERIDKAAVAFVRLDSAIVRFKRTIKTYPGKLDHLAFQITTNDKDSCGNNYTLGQVNDWAGSTIDTVGGSYIAVRVSASGLPLAGGLGYVRDSISRNPPGPNGVIELVVPNATEDDAIFLNDEIDGIADYVASDATSGNLTGKVRWTVPDANRFVTLTYNVIPPSSGC